MTLRDNYGFDDPMDRLVLEPVALESIDTSLIGGQQSYNSQRVLPPHLSDSPSMSSFTPSSWRICSWILAIYHVVALANLSVS